jgi:hypothetical protein
MTREDAIDKATAILARCYSPERIYLIGSSARGDAKPGSDLDFVVVLPDDAPCDLLWGAGAHQSCGRFHSQSTLSLSSGVLLSSAQVG